MSEGLRSVVDIVRPVVAGLVAPGSGIDEDAIVRQAVRANVMAAANRLRHESDLLKRRARDVGLVVLGAEYSLETGAVDFFDFNGFGEGA